METTSSDQPHILALPFIARKREVAQLQRLHAQRKHALILGPPGVGETAVVARLREKLDLMVCRQSKQFTSICESLEAQFGLEPADARLSQPAITTSTVGTTRACSIWTAASMSCFPPQAKSRQRPSGIDEQDGHRDCGRLRCDRHGVAGP